MLYFFFSTLTQEVCCANVLTHFQVVRETKLLRWIFFLGKLKLFKHYVGSVVHFDCILQEKKSQHFIFLDWALIYIEYIFDINHYYFKIKCTWY